jgi:hypothetical protein
MSAEAVYRENYEALSKLPIVKQLLKENKKLRRKVKTLETLLYEFPALFENRKKNEIKTEANVEPTLCDTLVDDDVEFVPKTEKPMMIYDLTTEEVRGDAPNVFIKIEKDEGVSVPALQEVEEEEEEVEEEEVEEEEVEEEEVEEVAKPAEDDTEVFEITIKGKAYYTNNETNGNIYKILDDEDVGPVVGKFVDGKAKFST